MRKPPYVTPLQRFRAMGHVPYVHKLDCIHCGVTWEQFRESDPLIECTEVVKGEEAETQEDKQAD